MQHYFLSFLWKRRGEHVWHPVDATTADEHPLDYIRRARITYGDEGHEYRLMFFAPIAGDLYRRTHPTPIGGVSGQ